MSWIYPLVVAVSICLVSPSVIAGQSAVALDIDGAINYALSQNKKLLRKAIDADAAVYSLEEADSEFLVRWSPELSFGYSNGNEEHGLGLQASKKFSSGARLTTSGNISEEFDDEAGEMINRGIVRVELHQPLFREYGTLVNRAAILQAGNDLKSARRNYERQKSDLIVEVVELYERLNRLKRIISIDRRFLDRMEGLYRITKAKEIVGRTTRIDTLRVELLQGQAASRLEKSLEQYDSAMKDFAELLGFSHDTVFELTPVPFLKIDTSSPEEAIRTALRNRLDYAQVLQDHEDASRKVEIARRNLLPDLRMTVSNEWSGEGGDTSDALNLDENTFFVGVTANTDTNRAAEHAKLGKSQTVELSASETIRIVELSIAREVHRHLMIFRRSRKELEITRNNLSLAAARLNLAKRLYGIGRSDNFSVTDSEEAFLQSETKLLNTRSEVIITGYRFLQAMGTLLEVPPDLKPSTLH